MTALEILKGIFEETSGGCYMAGTLASGGFAFSSKTYEPINGMFDRDESEAQIYSIEEKYWWSKCYIKYKTSDHAFWKEAQLAIKEYEE
jgi:hypothetical protein